MPNHSGDFYVKTARKNGLKVVPGKGSHVKIYGPAGRGYMVVPVHKSLSTGVECSIKKWFATLGIVVALLMPLTCLLAAVLS